MPFQSPHSPLKKQMVGTPEAAELSAPSRPAFIPRTCTSLFGGSVFLRTDCSAGVPLQAQSVAKVDGAVISS